MRLSRKRYISLSYKINVSAKGAHRYFSDRSYEWLSAAGFVGEAWSYNFKRTMPL